MVIREIKLSQKEKDQLSRLKSRTGLEHWNELCRWAINISLLEPTKPPNKNIPTDSNTVIPWHIFAGDYGDFYLDLIRMRCIEDGLNLDDDTVANQFRQHLKRGIGYMFANKKLRTAADLTSLL